MVAFLRVLFSFNFYVIVLTVRFRLPHIRQFFASFSHLEFTYVSDDYDWNKIKHLCAWILDIMIGLFLLDSDFIKKRMTFTEDQIFVGSFLVCIFFCTYFKVFCRLTLTGLQKYMLQMKYHRKKLVYS